MQLFVTPWAVAHQAPLSLVFPRQEYWSDLPFSSPGQLPDPGIKPKSPCLGRQLLYHWVTWEAHTVYNRTVFSDFFYLETFADLQHEFKRQSEKQCLQAFGSLMGTRQKLEFRAVTAVRIKGFGSWNKGNFKEVSSNIPCSFLPQHICQFLSCSGWKAWNSRIKFSKTVKIWAELWQFHSAGEIEIWFLGLSRWRSPVKYPRLSAEIPEMLFPRNRGKPAIDWLLL